MAKQAVTVELFYSAVWNDRTAAVLTRDEIEITHGRADESGQPAPSSVALTFNSYDFNPRNPASPLFGLIGRNTPIRITLGSSRFWGEVASWTPKRAVKGDEWVEVAASGVSRRLGQGDARPRDSVDRFVEYRLPSLTPVGAYWPLSDPKGSRVAESGIGGRAMTTKLLVGVGVTPTAGFFPFGFGSGIMHPWLPSGLEMTSGGDLQGGTLTGRMARPGHVDDWALDILYRATAQPGTSDAAPMDSSYFVRQRDGIEWHWSTGGDEIEVAAFDADGVVIGGDTFPSENLADGDLHHVRLRVTHTTGNNAQAFLYLDGEVISTAISLDIGTATVRPPDRIEINWFSSEGQSPPRTLPIHIGQVIVWSGVGLVDTPDLLFEAINGHPSESATGRASRVAGIDEDDIGITVDDPEPRTFLGPQYPGTLLEILRAGADTDLGILFDSRDALGLVYRGRSSLYNQDAALALDFDAEQVAPPLDPVVDDQATRNDITATRRDGGNRRKTLDEGPLSVQEPPDGAGRYRESVTIDVAHDILLEDQVGWRLHLGTVDETRYPQVSVDLDATPELAAAASAVGIGDRITIANLPAGISPDMASLLVQGYTETIGSHRRRITFNCTPERPWVVGVYADVAETPDPDEPKRYSPVDSRTLATFVTGTDTALSVSADSSGGTDQWTEDPATLPFDINLLGARLRVTAVGPVVSFAQTLTVQQTPINGVVKTIPTTTAVQLWTPARYAL